MADTGPDRASEGSKELIPASVRWPVMIVALLGVNVLICFYTIATALSNPATLEKDYYERAVDWDNVRAVREAADRLGWTVALLVRDGGSTATLDVRTADGSAVPLDSAELEYWHRARAADVRTASFGAPVDGTTEPGLGRAAPIEIRSPGIWEFRLTLRAGETEAEVTREINVTAHALRSTDS